MVISYDYTVLAGTQGHMNHKKIDRMLGLAEQWRMPLVFYGEGGGGRPGDTDRLGMTGLDGPSFVQFAKLSGLVPVVGVVSGYCFAGNAAMLGCCDVIIATKNASIGMGGPAMIEGGGLGVYHPAEVGPVSFQAPNGVIDILVEDEEEATAAAQKYLSYFQGAVADWKAPDQRLLRRAIPENRLRVYDIRTVIDLLADEGSVLEIRRDFGVGMITAFIRIEGKPFGLIANNPKHLGGAIDAPAGDKAARFMQLCDAFDIPIVSLCDTPGFMVGPEAEKTAIVRHVARMFVTGASLTVPLFGIVLRKGYGLGAQSMIGGGFHASFFTVAWPTGEFGGMGLEGYVRLGFRKEMEAIADPAEREKYYQAKVAELYANGKATSIASVLEIDEVIDPADTRRWIMAGLHSVPKPEPRTASGPASMPGERTQDRRMNVGKSRSGDPVISRALLLLERWSPHRAHDSEPVPHPTGPLQAGMTVNALPQPQLLIPLRRHLVAPGAVGRRAAAVAGDDAGLLALDVGIDAGHPGIDLVGQQPHAERLDVIGPGFHAFRRRLQPRQLLFRRETHQARSPSRRCTRCCAEYCRARCAVPSASACWEIHGP